MSDSASEGGNRSVAGSPVFETTHWSVVLAAGNKDNPQAAEAMEKLCRTYWYPLYAFVRRKGYSVEEAEDLTQEFFGRLLRRDFPTGIQPEGGKFRSYLLAALKNLMANEWQSRQTQKRGGGQATFSLDELDAESRYQLEPADPSTPEALYERRWASILLEEVTRQLRSEYTAQGKAELFDFLKAYLTGAEPLLPYADLAQRLGMTEAAVKMAVHRLRKRFGQLLRREIAQTVNGPEEVEGEIRHLISATAR